MAPGCKRSRGTRVRQLALAFGPAVIGDAKVRADHGRSWMSKLRTATDQREACRCVDELTPDQCENSVGTVMWRAISRVAPPNTNSRMRE